MAGIAEPLDRPSTATFAVTADSCPQLLCRILGYIAQQGRVADAVEAVRTGDRLQIRICLSDIDADRATVLAEKMRTLIRAVVVDVRMSEPLT